MKLAVLVAEGDVSLRAMICEALHAAGHSAVAVEDHQAALARLADAPFDVLVSDLKSDRVDGLALLHQVKLHAAAIAVILVTAGDVQGLAAQALKEDVDDHVTKPFAVLDLVLRIERLGERRRVEHELRLARAGANGNGAGGASSKLIGRSPLMRSLIERVETIAPANASVLVVGESGTGKELVARAVHEASSRASGPFVAVNCAAFPESLIEAELFGHERGAFTGATHRREGRFKAADGGTLLLDEVGEIPLSVQAKLLRVLQEGAVEPLGSNRQIELDVRLICATHRNLRQMVGAGTFREDLYYRLNVLDIHVPPLRRRRADLALLVGHFYGRFAGDGAEPKITPRAWAALMSHPFPGNVRELEHAIQHAVVLARGGEIDIWHLPYDLRGDIDADEPASSTFRPLSESMRDFERQCLLVALNHSSGAKREAARLLGISRKTLWEKLKSHQISSHEE
ncbi:MAG TPA: sigma-54 dependent transcriptional regulator [Polyangiaceae bacterium]|nr:sigma-54 dependent transcriptional regulator [Polyangiaceae bacterium]